MLTPPLYPLLIVDAAPAAHTCLRAMCREAGYRVALAPNTDAACSELAVHRFRLILAAAVPTPWAARWTALDLLRQAAGPTPIVLLAATGLTPFVGYRARGFADLLAVPRGAADLCAVLRDYLEAA